MTDRERGYEDTGTGGTGPLVDPEESEGDAIGQPMPGTEHPGTGIHPPGSGDVPDDGEDAGIEIDDRQEGLGP